MKTLIDYDEFVASKSRKAMAHGFEPMPFTGPLFDWQKQVVAWAIRKGRAALFEECGLGKTLQQLEWADQVSKHTGKPVLILTPLAVARQTESESSRFGYSARMAYDALDVTNGVVITNYDKLDHFDDIDFAGVVLDESSILKNFTGKTRRRLTDRFAETRFRLCCTATPSPNDYTEFGQHADFLGVCSPAQMLATYFINDTFNTGDWRLKKHAEKSFWEWVSSWAACISKPSDIGFDDTGYILPPLNLETRIVDVDEVQGRDESELFRVATLSATTMHQELKMTAENRVTEVAKLVNNSNESWLVWCNTNLESDLLAEAIPDAVEVRGSDTTKFKETAIADFLDGKKRVLISKAGMMGYGLNFQHCRNVAFVGLSYSFEDFYQALRRSYRFGQTRQVNAYVVHAATEGAIMKTIRRKMEQHTQMQEQMKMAAECFMGEQSSDWNIKPRIRMLVSNWLLDNSAKGGENEPCLKYNANADSAESKFLDMMDCQHTTVTSNANPNGKSSSGQSQPNGLDKSMNQKGLIALKLPSWLTGIQSQSGIGSSPAGSKQGGGDTHQQSHSGRATKDASEESSAIQQKRKSDRPESKTEESHVTLMESTGCTNMDESQHHGKAASPKIGNQSIHQSNGRKPPESSESATNTPARNAG